MALTRAEANRIINGAIAKAEELGIRISVAVVDTGGRLLAFSRMDGAIWAGVYGSQGKAVASSAFGRPSAGLDPARPVIHGIVEADGHMIIGQGGLPIIRDGELIGAVGAGGGTGEQDEECSAAGIARL